MNVFAHITALAQRTIRHYEKIQTMNDLQALGDAQLADIGISRALLARGVSAYPWTNLESAEINQPAYTATLMQFKRTDSVPVTVYDQPRLAA